jgi:hypothetical protein
MSVATCAKKVCNEAYVKKQEKAMQGFTNEIGRIMKLRNSTYKKRPTKKPMITKQQRDGIIDSCKEMYCNPTCKNTFFQKKSNITNKSKLAMRKSIVGTKNNVITNGFYNGLSKKDSDRLRKRGALSGCYKHSGI